VYPNEGLRPKPEPFALYAVRDVRTPLAATDDHGHDVLERISRIDQRYPDDFAAESTRGYAASHSLTLTLPPANGRRVLLLTGWTDYAFSSDNLAASQRGLRLIPPALAYSDPPDLPRPTWRTAIEDIGFPVGRPQTVVIDLDGKVPPSTAQVRITTTMRVYWDRILAATTDGGVRPIVTRLDPASAILR